MTPSETDALALATRARLDAMEKWDAHRERTLLVDGGRVDNASSGHTYVRWKTRVPNMCELEQLGDELAHRIGTLEKLRTGIRPTRKRAAPRVNYERSRAAYEQSGADSINGYSSKAARPVALRIFYRSFGDEILVCESEPMTYVSAKRAKGTGHDRFGWALHVEIVPATPNSMHAIREVALPYALVKTTGKAAARFVVFPSQRSEAVEQS